MDALQTFADHVLRPALARSRPPWPSADGGKTRGRARAEACALAGIARFPGRLRDLMTGETWPPPSRVVWRPAPSTWVPTDHLTTGFRRLDPRLEDGLSDLDAYEVFLRTASETLRSRRPDLLELVRERVATYVAQFDLWHRAACTVGLKDCPNPLEPLLGVWFEGYGLDTLEGDAVALADPEM